MTRAKLETIAGPRSLADVAEWLTRGRFFTHQDGRWRFYRWHHPDPSAAVCYVDSDPSEFLPERCDVGKQWARCDPAAGIVAMRHSDGTSGCEPWNGKTERLAAAMYKPLNKAHGELRDWLAERMP